MASSHTFSTAMAVDGSTTLSNSNSYSGSSRTTISESVVTASTDLLITVAIDVSTVKSFYLNSTCAATVETNSGGSPTNTIVLKAGVPYIWNTDSYDTFKLTGDVTAIYITNASGSTADITLDVVQDATP